MPRRPVDDPPDDPLPDVDDPATPLDPALWSRRDRARAIELAHRRLRAGPVDLAERVWSAVNVPMLPGDADPGPLLALAADPNAAVSSRVLAAMLADDADATTVFQSADVSVDPRLGISVLDDLVSTKLAIAMMRPRDDATSECMEMLIDAAGVPTADRWRSAVHLAAGASFAEFAVHGKKGAPRREAETVVVREAGVATKIWADLQSQLLDAGPKRDRAIRIAAGLGAKLSQANALSAPPGGASLHEEPDGRHLLLEHAIATRLSVFLTVRREPSGRTEFVVGIPMPNWYGGGRKTGKSDASMSMADGVQLLAEWLDEDLERRRSVDRHALGVLAQVETRTAPIGRIGGERSRAARPS